MSTLRSALQEWKSEDLADRPTEQLAADLVELELVDGWMQVESPPGADHGPTALTNLRLLCRQPHTLTGGPDRP